MPYSISIVSLNSVKSLYKRKFPEIATEYSLSLDHKEPLYDWLVTQAAYEIMNEKCNVIVVDRFTNDLYSIINSFVAEDHVESIGWLFSTLLRKVISKVIDSYVKDEVVKLTVLDDVLLIARKIHV